MSTQEFVSYWQKILLSENPIEVLGLDSNGSELSQFQIDAAPEPYYGY